MFDKNLHQYGFKNREQLVHAGLTILHAYNSAGRPSQGLPPLGSFEPWSDWVRSSLVWCGLKDPCLTQLGVEDEDPESRSLKRMLTVWHSLFKGLILAKDVLKQAMERQESELYDAIEEFAGEPGSIGNRKFGARLQKYQNRTEGGLRLVQQGSKQRAALWSVEAMGEK